MAKVSGTMEVLLTFEFSFPQSVVSEDRIVLDAPFGYDRFFHTVCRTPGKKRKKTNNILKTTETMEYRCYRVGSKPSLDLALVYSLDPVDSIDQQADS